MALLLLAAAVAGPAGAERPCGPEAEAPRTVVLPGGTFRMGSDRHHPEERPVRAVTVGPFEIDRFEVTNAEFAAFVAATGYVTAAERPLDPARLPGAPPELLLPGSVVFRRPEVLRDPHDFRQWWAFVPGASWRTPEGPGSTIAGREQHPVVHVTREDALTYARWRGRDLPTEAEWEHAAHGGHEGEFAWGDRRLPAEGWPANVWQGPFPMGNRIADGWEGTAPVGCYDPNGFGLFDMAGNVWEITADDYRDLRGPLPGAVVVKGGSFLCADSYCDRYRPTARQPAAADTGSAHVGFRTIRRLP